MAKSALGRGIGALLEIDEVRTGGSSSVGEIELSKIKANPNQPRTHFDEDALNELAVSIKAVGLIQPITVRLMPNDSYQIISGERRYRASIKAGLTKVPAYIKTAEDEHVMKMALVENIQREDLNAIEEALAYQRLVDEYSLTQEKLSELVGRKRATVANYLRLLKLPAEIQLGITAKKIDMGHARALINIHNPEIQIEIYKQILNGDYTVRMVEDLVRAYNEDGANAIAKPVKKAEKQTFPEYEAAKEKLSALLHTDVKFSYKGKGKGKIEIPFSSEQELQQIISLLEKEAE